MFFIKIKNSIIPSAKSMHGDSSECNFVAVGFLDVEQGFIDKN